MSNNDFGQPRILVRETDDYMQHNSHGDSQEPPSGPPNGWIRHVLQPALLVTLISCIMWPTSAMIATLSPTADPTLLLLIPVVMGLVGFTTQRRLQRELLSGMEMTRFRLVELGVIFILIKITSHFQNTLPEMGAIMRTWSQEPLSFFDAQTMVTFFIGIVIWQAGSATARDLDAISDPAMVIGGAEPRARLMKRYFVGGAILMVFAALHRVSLPDLIMLEQQRIRRPIVSALIYFLVGLLTLGLVRLVHLIQLWRRDRVVVADTLNIAWLRYLAIFLVLISAIAFVLPTGYTLGFLDLVSVLISGLISFVMLLYTLITWPLALIISLLSGKGDNLPPAPAIEPPKLEPETMVPGAGVGPWWDVLRSVVFWVVLIGVIIVLVRSYLRDHPDLWRIVQGIRPRHWIEQLWHAIRRLLNSMGHAVQAALPVLSERLQRRRARIRERRRQRAAGPTLRERVFYHYLRTLETAQEKGHPRRRTDTPYEYERTLGPHLTEEAAAMTALTEAFVEARYSNHPITADDVTAQLDNAERVIEQLKQEEDTEPA